MREKAIRRVHAEQCPGENYDWDGNTAQLPLGVYVGLIMIEWLITESQSGLYLIGYFRVVQRIV